MNPPNLSLGFLFFLLFLSPVYAQDKYDVFWQQIESYELKQLHKSANQLVDSVYQLAKQEKNEIQEIKSLIYQSKFSLALEEDAQVRIVHNFEQKIASTEGVYRNILSSMLGELYWQYYQQNRWRFYNRTQTATVVDSQDFRTWDIHNLLNKISKNYLASLDNKISLQSHSLDEFNVLIHFPDNKDIGKKLRPTVYDFLAYQALGFFTQAESSVNKPREIYYVDGPKLLADYRYLLNPESDSSSFVYQSLSIYKELLEFHVAATDPSAFVYSSVQRMEFLYGLINYQQKDKIYEQELMNLYDQYKALDISTYLQFKLGEHYFRLGNRYDPKSATEYQFHKRKAVEICSEAIDKFPGSLGAKLCKNLKEIIEASSLSITGDKHIPIDSNSKFLVEYTNLDSINFIVYAILPDQEDSLLKIYNDEAKKTFINQLTKVNSWTNTLINENDFQRHRMEILVPPMQQGYYLIVAENTSQEVKSLYYHFVNMTNLALIYHQMKGKKILQVIDRNDGKPIEKASIYFDQLLDTIHFTDSTGYVELASKDSWHAVEAKVSKGNDVAYFRNISFYNYYNEENRDQKEEVNSFLFTDRSIYRPGQTIYFKGILIKTEETTSPNDRKTRGVATNEKVKIILEDVNRKTIQELELVSNEYGSFSGELVLPASGLTGAYKILVQASESKTIQNSKSHQIIFHTGRYIVTVEEYKRPTFEVGFLPIKERYSVNDTVLVQGVASSYTGSKLSGAKVSYRIFRRVQMPLRFYSSNFARSFPHVENQEIGFGENFTDVDGNFNIEFTAVPDDNVDREHLPVFQYQVTADVTDLNGETRSSTVIIRVGYHNLLATASIPNLISKLDAKLNISVSTQNLNHEFIPSKGIISIYKVKKPDRVIRDRSWENPDYNKWTEEEFIELFPYDLYDENILNEPEKGKLVWKKVFDTGKHKELPLTGLKKWEEGLYVMELEALDDKGQLVKDIQTFTLIDPVSDEVPDNDLFLITTDKKSYHVGDQVKLRIGSAAKDIYVTIRKENSQGILPAEIVRLNNEIKELSFPITGYEINGFAIHYHIAFANSFRYGTLSIPVSKKEETIEIETLTFRDKILPGGTETWSFRIKGTQKERYAAEILAGMYDASLDQFKSHSWSFDPLYQMGFFPRFQIVNYISFGPRNFHNLNGSYIDFVSEPELKFPNINWFGFSLNQNYSIYHHYINQIQRKHIQNKVSDRQDDLLEEGYVQGHIYEITGEPISGVSVSVKGKPERTISDSKGFYRIKAIKEDQLIIFLVGMESLYKVVDDKNVIDFYMVPNYEELNEVMVTGYGNMQNRGIKVKLSAASLAEVSDFEEINDIPTTEQPSLPEENIFQLQARTNFAETAFFFPHLQTDKEGNFSFTFTAPESLTKWKLQLLAHTQDLISQSKTFSTTTQKELMIIPNAPRFLRQGDKLVLSTKIINMGEKPLEGTVGLELRDGLSEELLKNIISENNTQTSFKVDAKGNTLVSWTLDIPKNLQALQYKIIASAGNFSDGEQNYIPILPNRMLVTETLPFWVNSGEARTFNFDKLITQDSPTLRHHKLSMELTSNPIWYAVQALPYLVEGPKENSEQVFAQIFANAIGSHILNSQPRIKLVFDQWANADALISNLEKNQELKSIILEETPWLRDAQSEAEQKKRIALLFETNQIQKDLPIVFERLKQYQLTDGGFKWYTGSPYANSHITKHILQGLGQIRHIGINVESSDYNLIINNGIRYLNNSLLKDYALAQGKINSDSTLAYPKGSFQINEALTAPVINTLYTKSYFGRDTLDKKLEEAVSFYMSLLPDHWTSFGLSEKAMMALILHRNGSHKQVVEDIMESLVETSTLSEEMGRYWLENTAGWGWNESPVEIQSMLIETFSEIDGKRNHREFIEELKIWLLKNKQTNRWKTTKATTAAVYAIISSGTDLMSTALPNITLGGENIAPSDMIEDDVEVGTGYFKKAWEGEYIKPDMGKIVVQNKESGIAWGALYWQYFEELDKITAASTSLQINKKLFLKTNTDKGELLRVIDKNSNLRVGDLVRVRIEIKVDRNMEFVHLKDMRASGMEPVNVLSSFKYQGGLGYYESTGDVASHFYFEQLPKGVFVFEYDLRVSHVGLFSNGITTIQSMYAPEFSSHSEGTNIEVNNMVK